MIVHKVDNYITFNLIIRFHELKCPGKEIIKATTWGTRHNNLPRLVALSKRSLFMAGGTCNPTGDSFQITRLSWTIPLADLCAPLNVG